MVTLRDVDAAAATSGIMAFFRRLVGEMEPNSEVVVHEAAPSTITITVSAGHHVLPPPTTLAGTTTTAPLTPTPRPVDVEEDVPVYIMPSTSVPFSPSIARSPVTLPPPPPPSPASPVTLPVPLALPPAEAEEPTYMDLFKELMQRIWCF